MHFLHRTPFVQFTFSQNVVDVLGDDRAITTEKFADLSLGHPERVAIKPYVETQPFCTIVNQKTVTRFLIFDEMNRFVFVATHVPSDSNRGEHTSNL